MRFEFCSALPADYRDDLESLMFFNPLQRVAAAGVAQSVEAFGAPAITTLGDSLTVTMPDRQVQPLFALAESADGCELAGVILYVRVDARSITVLHVAVSERFSSAGTDGSAMLVMRLLKEVARSARRIGGVRLVTILYCRRHIVLRVECGAKPHLDAKPQLEKCAG